MILPDTGGILDRSRWDTSRTMAGHWLDICRIRTGYLWDGCRTVGWPSTGHEPDDSVYVYFRQNGHALTGEFAPPHGGS